MRKIIISVVAFCFLCIPQKSFADAIVSTNSPAKVLPAATDFAKSYKTSSENLLYLLLAAINEHNYLIEEIQFKTGSVLFKAYTKEFIASVSEKDGYNSFIKIIPADNNYNFSPILLQKLHTYIELNNNINFQKVL